MNQPCCSLSRRLSQSSMLANCFTKTRYKSWEGVSMDHGRCRLLGPAMSGTTPSPTNILPARLGSAVPVHSTGFHQEPDANASCCSSLQQDVWQLLVVGGAATDTCPCARADGPLPVTCSCSGTVTTRPPEGLRLTCTRHGSVAAGPCHGRAWDGHVRDLQQGRQVSIQIAAGAKQVGSINVLHAVMESVQALCPTRWGR